jgi:hypothetical protein
MENPVLGAALDLGRALRCFVFGHATYEQLLQPFRGLTAKAVLHEVSEELAAARRCAHNWLTSTGVWRAKWQPDDIVIRALSPFATAGPARGDGGQRKPSYYDDAWQFRAGRTRRRV